MAENTRSKDKAVNPSGQFTESRNYLLLAGDPLDAIQPQDDMLQCNINTSSQQWWNKCAIFAWFLPVFRRSEASSKVSLNQRERALA